MIIVTMWRITRPHEAFYSFNDAVCVKTHLLFFCNLVEAIFMTVFVKTHTF